MQFVSYLFGFYDSFWLKKDIHYFTFLIIMVFDGLIQYEFIPYMISSCDTCYVKNLFKNKQRICGYKLYKNT